MILSKEEVAAELGISTKTLERKLFERHEPIKYYKESNKLYFPLLAFAEYLENFQQMCA